MEKKERGRILRPYYVYETNEETGERMFQVLILAQNKKEASRMIENKFEEVEMVMGEN